MSKKLVIALVATVLLVSSAGCKDLIGKIMPTPEPVVLRFLFPQQSKEARYLQAAEAFHAKYPYITVQVERNGNIPRAINTGGVDVVEAEQFDYPVLLQREAIRELSTFLDINKDFPVDDFYPKLWEVYREQDRTWGIPANADPMVLFYNKDHLDRAQAAYPQAGWDWNDFLITAQKLSLDPLVGQKAFLPDPYGIGMWAFIYQGGGQLVDDLEKPTRAMLDDEQVIRAVEWYVALANEHRVMPVITYSSGDTWNTVMNSVRWGQAGMWMLLLSERGGQNQREPWDYEWGVAPLPQDEARVTFMISSAYFMTADTAHPQESWLWLNYLATKADLDWDVPPRRSVAEDENYRKWVGEEMYAVIQETGEYGMTLPAAAWLTQVPLQSVGLIDAIMTGRKTAEEGLEEMQAQWDAAIQSLNSDE